MNIYEHLNYLNDQARMIEHQCPVIKNQWVDVYVNGEVSRKYYVEKFEINNGLYAVLTDAAGINSIRMDIAEYGTKWGKAGTLR